MMTEERIKELEGKGFKRWQKGNYDRLYINATALGLVVDRYKTGNISYAEFNGERISNTQGTKMVDAKTYIDVNTERLFSTNETLKEAAAKLAGIEA
jgi:hypothetical protein